MTGVITSTGGSINNLFGGPATLTTTAGATTLSGDNGFTGATTLRGGTLTASGANAFSQNSATTILAGGLVDLGGAAQAINTINLAGGALQNGSLTGAVTSSGGALNGIGGSAGLTTTADVTMLSGTNSYSGATNVNGGILTASTTNAFSPGSVTTVNAGGTLDLGRPFSGDQHRQSRRRDDPERRLRLPGPAPLEPGAGHFFHRGRHKQYWWRSEPVGDRRRDDAFRLEQLWRGHVRQRRRFDRVNGERFLGG